MNKYSNQPNILKKKINTLNSLIKINHQLNSSLNLENILKKAITIAEKYLNAQTSSILLKDPKTNNLNFYISTGKKQQKLKKITIPKGKGIAGFVVKTGISKLIENTKKEPKFLKDVDTALKFKTNTMIAVQLKTKKKIIGVLEIINKKKNIPFNTNDLEFAESLSSIIALAVENAMLYNQVFEEEKKFEAVLGSSNDGIVLIDTNNKIFLCNSSAKNILGQTNDIYIGRDLFTYLKPFRLSSPLKGWQKSQKNYFSFEMALEEFLDTIFLVDAAKIKDSKNQLKGLLLIFRNISELKKVTKIKSEFVGIVSHKLRTPLTLIKEPINLLLEGLLGELTEKQKNIIFSMKSQSQHLEFLINKLLDFSEIERNASNITLKKDHVLMNNLIEECVDELKPLSNGKSISINIDSKNYVLTLTIDKTRIRQAIINILENSIKFSPQKSSIIISLDKNNTYGIIKIHDQGPGIPRHEISHIFDSFYQVDKYKTGQIPGIGLGLTITKQIIELHDGLIKINSPKGLGTTVSIFLPV